MLMIIQVGFASPVFKHPLPPGGTTPGGSVIGFEIVLEVVKSIKPEPAGATENELLVHTLTAAVQSVAVVGWANAFIAKSHKAAKVKIFLIGVDLGVSA
jgi:hypothetical protein